VGLANMLPGSFMFKQPFILSGSVKRGATAVLLVKLSSFRFFKPSQKSKRIGSAILFLITHEPLNHTVQKHCSTAVCWCVCARSFRTCVSTKCQMQSRNSCGTCIGTPSTLTYLTPPPTVPPPSNRRRLGRAPLRQSGSPLEIIF